MRAAFLPILLLLAAPAAAQDSMTGAEFAAYTHGQTIAFADADGRIVGVERYLPDRRVIWGPAGQPCQDGIWYARDDAGHVCFAYNGVQEHKCWAITVTPGGLRAVFQGDNPSLLFEAGRDLPLACAGPELLSGLMPPPVAARSGPAPAR